MVSGSATAFGYDSKVDSWSLGTILYILYACKGTAGAKSSRLCGYHPFDPQGTSSDNEMMKAIRSCRFDFEDEAWDGVSEGAKDLIRHLLVLDPTDRFSMTQVLSHEWMRGMAGQEVTVSPLSPTIHRDLARYRANSRGKSFFEDDETEAKPLHR